MPSLLDQIQMGANKLAFEADKAMRLSKAQSELSALLSKLDQAYRELGRATYGLQSREKFQIESLHPLFKQIESLLAAINDKETEITHIRAQMFIVPVRPQVTQPLPPDLQPRSTEKPSSQTKTCRNCNASIPSNAVFCPECGSKCV